MITKSTEAKVTTAIEANIPEIVKVQFKAPPRFDGATVPHYGFFNTETGHCLENLTAKEGYEETTRQDYIALASAAVDAMNVDDATVKAFWTQSKSSAEATIIVAPSNSERLSRYDIGGNDAIFPRLVIRAPYGKKFQFSCGLYRDECRNLDIPRAVNGLASVNMKHTASLRDRMPELIRLCQSACNFETMVAKLNDLNSIDAKISDVLAELYPLPENATANVRTRYENRARAIYSRIHKESLALDGASRNDDTASLWRIVQAVTGYVQHDKTRKNGLSTTARAVAGLNDAESLDVWKYAGAHLLTA